MVDISPYGDTAMKFGKSRHFKDNLQAPETRAIVCGHDSPGPMTGQRSVWGGILIGIYENGLGRYRCTVYNSDDMKSMLNTKRDAGSEEAICAKLF